MNLVYTQFASSLEAHFGRKWIHSEAPELTDSILDEASPGVDGVQLTSSGIDALLIFTVFDHFLY